MNRNTNILTSCLLAFCVLLLSVQANAKSSYLNSVNSTCGTNYDCNLCHTAVPALNSDGQAFRNSGYDPTYFCPGTECTDSDGDGFAVEGGTCGPIDCDDKNASINPGAAEICDDFTDNDCDGNADCADGECRNALVCIITSDPEICDDGIDNDGDKKVDCADKKDCRLDPACGRNSGPAEICFDGIDNDGDNKVDCADKKDCGKDPVCR